MARTFYGQVPALATPGSDRDLISRSYVDRYAPALARALTAEGTDGTSGIGTAVTTFARTARTLHRVIGASRALRLEYQNWYTQPNTPGEVNNPNAITVRASVEYPAGTWRQVSGSTTWSAATVYNPQDQVVYSGAAYVALTTTTAGTAPTAALGTEWQAVQRFDVHWTGEDANRRVSIPAGGEAVSLPVFLSVVEGQYAAVTTTVVTGSASAAFPGDIQGSGAQDFVIDYPSAAPTPGTQDLVDRNVTTETSAAVGTRIMQPSCVWGLAATPELARWVAFTGDSLIMGYGDTKTESHQKGFVVRAAEYEDVRYRRIHQGGDRMQFWSAANAPKRLALAQRATAVLCDLGSNDISNSRTLAQLQADAIATWTELGRYGAKVFQTTITPKTTSTDNWATRAGQTVESAGFNTVRQGFNSWLRNGASATINGQTVTVGMTGHPLTAVVDITGRVEDPSDNTKWKTNGTAFAYTTDGGHPSAAGYDLLAQGLREHLSKMVLGDKLKINPASIGAADVGTLGGYLPGLTGTGGLNSFLYRGFLSETIPYWAAVSQTPVLPAQQYAVLLPYYATTQMINSLVFYVATAGASLTTQVASVYFGTSVTSMTKLGADLALTLTTTGLKKVALSPGQMPDSNGYVAVVFNTAGTTRPRLLASADSSFNPVGLTIAGGPVATVSTAAGTSNPATLNLGSGWTAGTDYHIPWVAVANN